MQLVYGQSVDQKTSISQYFKGRKLYIKDSTRYASSFINDLREICPSTDSIIVLDDRLYVYEKNYDENRIIHSKYAFPLPAELPLNKAATYKADQEGSKYELKLIRTNYTDIQYELKINDQVKKSGQVMLLGNYFFGAECGPDHKGAEYCSNQYFSQGFYDKSDCYIRLTIEIKSGERVSFRENCRQDKNGLTGIPVLTRDINIVE